MALVERRVSQVVPAVLDVRTHITKQRIDSLFTLATRDSSPEKSGRRLSLGTAIENNQRIMLEKVAESPILLVDMPYIPATREKLSVLPPEQQSDIAAYAEKLGCSVDNLYDPNFSLDMLSHISDDPFNHFYSLPYKEQNAIGFLTVMRFELISQSAGQAMITEVKKRIKAKMPLFYSERETQFSVREDKYAAGSFSIRDGKPLFTLSIPQLKDTLDYYCAAERYFDTKGQASFFATTTHELLHQGLNSRTLNVTFKVDDAPNTSILRALDEGYAVMGTVHVMEDTANAARREGNDEWANALDEVNHYNVAFYQQTDSLQKLEHDLRKSGDGATLTPERFETEAELSRAYMLSIQNKLVRWAEKRLALQPGDLEYESQSEARTKLEKIMDAHPAIKSYDFMSQYWAGMWILAKLEDLIGEDAVYGMHGAKLIVQYIDFFACKDIFKQKGLSLYDTIVFDDPRKIPGLAEHPAVQESYAKK